MSLLRINFGENVFNVEMPFLYSVVEIIQVASNLHASSFH